MALRVYLRDCHLNPLLTLLNSVFLPGLCRGRAFYDPQFLSHTVHITSRHPLRACAPQRDAAALLPEDVAGIMLLLRPEGPPHASTTTTTTTTPTTTSTATATNAPIAPGIPDVPSRASLSSPHGLAASAGANSSTGAVVRHTSSRARHRHGGGRGCGRHHSAARRCEQQGLAADRPWGSWPHIRRIFRPRPPAATRFRSGQMARGLRVGGRREGELPPNWVYRGRMADETAC